MVSASYNWKVGIFKVLTYFCSLFDLDHYWIILNNSFLIKIVIFYCFNKIELLQLDIYFWSNFFFLGSYIIDACSFRRHSELISEGFYHNNLQSPYISMGRSALFSWFKFFVFTFFCI
jgi:hypothetical protein